MLEPFEFNLINYKELLPHMKNYIIDYLLTEELERKVYALTPKLSESLDNVIADKVAFTATLTKKQKELFDKSSNSEAAHHLKQTEHYFTEGFKSGILIGLQVAERSIQTEEEEEK